jgi:prepilin-type N-terminal cleavage/methylation domain-containing protein
MQQAQKGFTLIELMIVVVSIGILAAIAVPTYQSYVQKARFTEVVGATAPFKLGVESCFLYTQDLTACDSGTNGVPAAAGASGFVTSVAVVDGQITGIGNALTGGATVILTPALAPAGSSALLTWSLAAGKLVLKEVEEDKDKDKDKDEDEDEDEDKDEDDDK